MTDENAPQDHPALDHINEIKALLKACELSKMQDAYDILVNAVQTFNDQQEEHTPAHRITVMSVLAYMTGAQAAKTVLMVESLGGDPSALALKTLADSEFYRGFYQHNESVEDATRGGENESKKFSH